MHGNMAECLVPDIRDAGEQGKVGWRGGSSCEYCVLDCQRMRKTEDVARSERLLIIVAHGFVFGVTEDTRSGLC